MEHLEKGRVGVARVGGSHLETWDPQWLASPSHLSSAQIWSEAHSAPDPTS